MMNECEAVNECEATGTDFNDSESQSLSRKVCPIATGGGETTWFYSLLFIVCTLTLLEENVEDESSSGWMDHVYLSLPCVSHAYFVYSNDRLTIEAESPFWGSAVAPSLWQSLVDDLDL